MGYTALQEMREFNRKRFGEDVGPFDPEKYFKPFEKDLKSAALRFLHNRCEGLKFDAEITKDEHPDKLQFAGDSLDKNQIPYNMQMDINRLCMERELEHFIDSGVAEDAYNVYYCYLEIFFGHYGKSKKMIELLSEFESNGSSLLMKHRDHYSHSVYVFALGLAIYDTNKYYRNAFKAFYGFQTEDVDKTEEGVDQDFVYTEEDREAARVFLEYWGLTSLFHDIGYPFELPFEQVISYFEVDDKKRGKDAVLIAYKDVDVLTKISEEANRIFAQENMYGRTFDSTTEFFAYELVKKLGVYYGLNETTLLNQLNIKPTNPECFNFYMDHAWFSANRLFQELIKPNEDGEISTQLNEKHIDALTAILMHNSLYKFTIADNYKKNRKPLMQMDWHPLAFLLMLCDELQCWDRTAYGRNSRTELHPMGAEFNFSNCAVSVKYFYDQDEHEKIDTFENDYKLWKEGVLPKEPKLKAYGSMWEKNDSFRTDIEHIVDTTRIPLTVKADTREVDRKSKHTYLSVSNFLHLYDFAVSLHNRYSALYSNEKLTVEEMEKAFESLSLEYQLSNINQAKNFSRLLHKIECFYTDRPVDFEMVQKFSDRQTAVFAPLEHQRWIREHHEMGWSYGELYEKVDLPDELDKEAQRKRRKDYREQTRMHKLAMDGNPTDREIRIHYDRLSADDQDKDAEPFNCMLKLIKQYDGLRIYKLN